MSAPYLTMWLAWGAVIGLVLLAQGRERDDLLTVVTGAGFLATSAVFLVVALRRRGE